MKVSLQASLNAVINQWLEDNDAHDDRPSGLACENLGEMMGEAAGAVYEASHAGAMAGAKDPSSCGIED